MKNKIFFLILLFVFSLNAHASEFTGTVTNEVGFTGEGPFNSTTTSSQVPTPETYNLGTILSVCVGAIIITAIVIVAVSVKVTLDKKRLRQEKAAEEEEKYKEYEEDEEYDFHLQNKGASKLVDVIVKEMKDDSCQ